MPPRARSARRFSPPSLEQLGRRDVPSVNPVGAEFLVNTSTAGTQALATGVQGGTYGRHTVASDAAGNHVVVWESAHSGAGSDVYGQRFNALGAKVGGEFRINTTLAGDQAHASVAMDADGDFAVVWQNGSGINARLYNAAGAARTGELKVTGSGTFWLEDIAMDADGDFVVAYQAPRNLSTKVVYAQRYNSLGVAQKKAIQVETHNIGNAQVNAAMDDDGDFLIASPSGINRFDRLGNKLGVVANVGSNQAVDMDGVGNFVVTWINGAAGFREARLYNANGTPRGGSFVVDGTWGGQSSGVSMNAAGDFTIVWSDGSAAPDVQARAYAASGAFLGGATANPTTAGAQGNPSVAMAAGGEFVIVWEGNGPGDDAGVIGQRFGPSTAAASLPPSPLIFWTLSEKRDPHDVWAYGEGK
ncbi:MAG: hypothetical protein U0797_11635 [Gemmataceae bacterium]